MAVRYDSTRKRFYTEFEQAGERVFKRFPKGITRAQAEAWERLKRQEIFDRGELDRKPDLTIGDAIDLWLNDNRRKNQRQAASEAKQWEKWRGKLLRDAPEVAGEAVKQWTALRTVPHGKQAASVANGGRVARASTLNRRLMLLKAVCKAMWRQKRIPDNLSGRIQTLREPKGKELYLTRSQVKSLAAGAGSSKVRDAITTLAYTGLRASELVQATPQDLQRGTLAVLGKGDKRRAVPVPPSQASVVRSALPLGMSYWQLRKEFIKTRKAAGIGKEVTLHTLRHTYASWFLQPPHCGDLYTLSKIMGHSTIYVTTRYGHLATEHLKAAVANLK